MKISLFQSLGEILRSSPRQKQHFHTSQRQSSQGEKGSWTLQQRRKFEKKLKLYTLGWPISVISLNFQTDEWSKRRFSKGTCERPLLFKLIWKAAFVWVTPYLVQLTFSLEACSWKNGDLVFQRWSFFSILETCMGIDDPYVKKPRWRRNWNAISKMIKDGLAEGMITRKLCVEVLDLVLTSFQTSFFSGHHE